MRGERVLLLSLKQLAEDAPERPHVDGAGVSTVAHDHLRCAITGRGDDAREHVRAREGRDAGETDDGARPAREDTARAERAARRARETSAMFFRTPRAEFVFLPGRHAFVRVRFVVAARLSVGVVRGGGAAGEPEVANLRDPAPRSVAAAERVCGFDVPVPHADVVEVLDRAGELTHQASNLRGAHLAAKLEEVASVGDLESHVEVDADGDEGEGFGIHASRAGGSGGVEHVENLNDVRVVEAVQHNHLAKHALRALQGVERVWDALEGDESTRVDVRGFAHRTVRAASEDAQQAVSRAHLPRLRLSALGVLDVVHAILSPWTNPRVRRPGRVAHESQQREDFAFGKKAQAFASAPRQHAARVRNQIHLFEAVQIGQPKKSR